MAQDLSPIEQDAYDLFAKYINSQGMQDFFEEELPDLYQALVGLPREEAQAFASELAAAKVKQITEPMRIDLAKQIVSGIQSGLSPDELADEIHNSIVLDTQRKASLGKFKAELLKQNLSDEQMQKMIQKETERLLADRAGTIAQNEIRQAIAAGNLVHATGTGATHKLSRSAGDGRVSDICLECESQGVIPIDQEFASGYQAAPHHVRCRCSTSYFTNPDESYLKELNDEAEAHANEVKNAQEQ